MNPSYKKSVTCNVLVSLKMCIDFVKVIIKVTSEQSFRFVYLQVKNEFRVFLNGLQNTDINTTTVKKEVVLLLFGNNYKKY